jgi:threonine/homoserine/homoserine lactone efflux protein
MELLSIFMFVITFGAILIIPGPNSAFAVGQSLKYGVMGSLVVPLGFMSATGLHAALVFSGLGLVVQQYSAVLIVFKWLGVFYLLYLAVKSFIAKPSKVEVAEQQIPKLKMYFSALFVSLTNPKALLASFMLYPLFINSYDSYLMQAVTLTLVAMTASFLIYASYSLAAVVFKKRLAGSATANNIVGSVYVGAAGMLAIK